MCSGVNWREHRHYGGIGKKTVEETISEAGRTSLFKLGGFGVLLQRKFTDPFFHARYELTEATHSSNLLVPRDFWLAPRIVISRLVCAIHGLSRQIWLTENTRRILCAYSENRVQLMMGVAILGAEQMERGLWSRECFSKCFSRRQKGKMKSELLVHIWIECAICTDKLLINFGTVV